MKNKKTIFIFFALLSGCVQSNTQVITSPTPSISASVIILPSSETSTPVPLQSLQPVIKPYNFGDNIVKLANDISGSSFITGIYTDDHGNVLFSRVDQSVYYLSGFSKGYNYINTTSNIPNAERNSFYLNKNGDGFSISFPAPVPGSHLGEIGYKPPAKDTLITYKNFKPENSYYSLDDNFSISYPYYDEQSNKWFYYNYQNNSINEFLIICLQLLFCQVKRV